MTAPKKRCWRNLSCKKLGKSKRAMHFHNWGMSKWEALFHFFTLYMLIFSYKGVLLTPLWVILIITPIIIRRLFPLGRPWFESSSLCDQACWISDMVPNYGETISAVGGSILFLVIHSFPKTGVYSLVLVVYQPSLLLKSSNLVGKHVLLLALL